MTEREGADRRVGHPEGGREPPTPSDNSARPTRTLGDVRRHNLSYALQLIHEDGPITRTELIVSTGLNRVTVFDLVDELQASGLIAEIDPQSTGRSGRPARALEIDRTNLAVAAVEINLGYISLAVATLHGDILATRRVGLRKNQSAPESVLKVAARLLSEAIAACRAEGRRLIHVTVPCLAVVDRKRGAITGSTPLGWGYVPVIAELRRRTSSELTFVIENVAIAALNGERQGQDWPRDAGVIMLYGDVGIGGAYQRGSNALHGDLDTGAIFGHITVDETGRRCFCGRRGCLMTCVGIGPLANALAGTPDGSPSSPLVPVAQTLADAEEAGPQVIAELDRQGRWLARAVDVLTAAFDPSVVVIGGALAQLAPMMMASCVEELNRRNPQPLFPYPKIVTSELGSDAAVRGGIAMSIHDIIREPWLAALTPQPVTP